jgi:hypothetical protein
MTLLQGFKNASSLQIYGIILMHLAIPSKDLEFYSKADTS